MAKLQFKTMRHGSTENYSLSSRDEKNLVLKDETMSFQQLIPKWLRWRMLDMITTSLDEAVKRSRLIDGSIKSVTDRYLDDVVMFHLVYGYPNSDQVKVQAVEPLSFNRDRLTL